MTTLSTELRNKLEKAVVEARRIAEEGATAALETLAVQHHEPYGHMSPEQRQLRNQLRARARQLGDKQDKAGKLDLTHIAHECAYEHWHRMLFARFLAENGLLIEPDSNVSVSLDDCKELAKDAKTDLWTLAGRYAQKMLPQIFRPEDPLLQVPLAKEHLLRLEGMLDDLPVEVFTASDSLGWCYQFWQTEKKDQVNASGNKIGADELPAVTQLFTEDYMVDFLLDNTLGAWHAGKVLVANPKLAQKAKSEDELRKAAALPGVEWKYLRFVRDDKTGWRPAAGTFDGWSKTAKELKCLDPCMGSGHFVVAMFERLVALRIAEEVLNEKDAVDAVIRENLYGLEIDPRCTQIAAFNLALAAWRRMGYCPLPEMSIACSGLAPNSSKDDWLKLAGKSEKLQRGMERLFDLFRNAPVFGSLINPRVAEGDLLVAAFHELQPLLGKALAQGVEDDSAHEMAVTARGLAKAAEILAGQFTVISTNVPYLARGRQDPTLKEFIEANHSQGKQDLATAFVQRCGEFCQRGGTTSLVTPQNWLFLGAYGKLRVLLLETMEWNIVARLGTGAFETISGEVVNVALVTLSHLKTGRPRRFCGIEASEVCGASEKMAVLRNGSFKEVEQAKQLDNPDARITFDAGSSLPLLSKYARCVQGVGTADANHYVVRFWELPGVDGDWVHYQMAPIANGIVSGCHSALRWEVGKGELCTSPQARVCGQPAWGKCGSAIAVTHGLYVGPYSGCKFDCTLGALVPLRDEYLLPVVCFVNAPDFVDQLRRIDKALSVTESSMTKVPFDLVHWQKIAAQKYPHGLPKPHSNDPTQWLFNGHPKSSDQQLQVAVARLLGYKWPRQTGSSFPACPALKPDGLEKLEDKDGIVCIPSVRGEPPAADRLLEMLTACGIKPDRDLDDWLRNEFFEEHCTLFHYRPFIWHIWDGRKRDGFHALLNYHKLAETKGRKVLESLTHSYLNDWITRQKDGVKRGEGGAEERLAAAQELKTRLEAILEGEPPFDIFVRWKPLAKQPIGWEPDINDGVRLNIRPFLASDIPGGKKGAGILRWKPNIKWDKDRGKEPHRPKADFPWFWFCDEKTTDFKGGKEFDGNRWNDCHYTNDLKRKARKEKP